MTPSKEDLLTLLKAHYDIIFWTVDRELHILDVAGIGLEKIHLTPEELIGKTLPEAGFSELDVGHHVQAFAGEPQHYTTIYRDRNLDVVLLAGEHYVTGVSMDITHRIRNMQQLLQGTEHRITVVLRMLAYQAGETEKHMIRVGLYSKIIAERLGWHPQEAQYLALAAEQHDIGKVGVELGLLRRPGKLTVGEFALVREHSEIGRAILSGAPDPIGLLAEQVAWTHHERWDGNGYPRGLKAEDIPEAGRVAALADCFDALITPRPYRSIPWDLTRVLDHVSAGKGKHFCPSAVDAFFASLGDVLRVMHEQEDIASVGGGSDEVRPLHPATGSEDKGPRTEGRG